MSGSSSQSYYNMHSTVIELRFFTDMDYAYDLRLHLHALNKTKQCRLFFLVASPSLFPVKNIIMYSVYHVYMGKIYFYII